MRMDALRVILNYLKNEFSYSLSQDNKQTCIAEYFVGEGIITENYTVTVKSARMSCLLAEVLIVILLCDHFTPQQERI